MFRASNIAYARGMASAVRIHRRVLEQLQSFAAASASAECCGLLAGVDGTITRVFPAVNALASATAYEIAPEELFRLMREVRAAGLILLGIYHSHPRGDNSPSPTDLARAYYPEAAYFILSPLPDTSRPIRAFAIREGCSTELELLVVSGA